MKGLKPRSGNTIIGALKSYFKRLADKMCIRDRAGHEHRDGNGAGHGLLKQGHEAAASGDGFDPVPLKFAGGVDEQRFELRRGAGQDFFGPDAAQDPADKMCIRDRNSIPYYGIKERAACRLPSKF